MATSVVFPLIKRGWLLVLDWAPGPHSGLQGTGVAASLQPGLPFAALLDVVSWVVGFATLSWLIIVVALALSAYAVSRIVITRTDSGHQQLNFSEILGSASAAAVATYSYHPSADRTPSNTAKVWGTQVGYDTITYVVKEFWPDIRRKVSKKKDSPSN